MDLQNILMQHGVAIRSGHHCAQPLHRALGVSSSARVSLYFYNTKEDVDYFIQALNDTVSFFNSFKQRSGNTKTSRFDGPQLELKLLDCKDYALFLALKKIVILIIILSILLCHLLQDHCPCNFLDKTIDFSQFQTLVYL